MAWAHMHTDINSMNKHWHKDGFSHHDVHFEMSTSGFKGF